MKMIKPFKTFDEQIEILRNRGMSVENEEDVKSFLASLNYYRISGYTLTLRKDDAFYNGVSFDNAMSIYNFDKELKYILLYHLENIEISLRSHLAYILGRQGGDCYFDESMYAAPELKDKFMVEIQRALGDNQNEAFVKHHNTKYGGVLPVWALVETLSFGTLSRLFSSLNVDIKNEIISEYYKDIPYKYIESWLESLVVVRNLCAHHARLYNRGLPHALKFCNNDKNFFLSRGYDGNAIGKRVFFHMVVISRISDYKNTQDNLVSSINNLCSKYPFVDIKHYGFKTRWIDILHEVNCQY